MVRDLVCGLELGSCGIAVVGAWAGAGLWQTSRV